MLAAKAVLQAPRLSSWCSCDRTVNGAEEEKGCKNHTMKAKMPAPRHPAAAFPQKTNSVEKNLKYTENAS